MKPWTSFVALVDRPAAAFAALAERPRAWFPIALLLLSLAVFSWFSAPAQVELANARTAEALQRIAANVTAEQAQVVQQTAVAQMTLVRYLLTSVGMGSIGLLLGLVTRAGFLFFTGQALGSKAAWNVTFATVAWSAVPLVWRNVLQTVLMLLGRGISTHAGLSFLVSSGDWLVDGRNPLYALLGQIDLFALWSAILLFVGVSTTMAISRRAAAIVVAAMWLVFAAIGLIPVYIGSALSSSYLD